MAFSCQNVDAATHAIQGGISGTVAEAKTATLPHLNRVGKNLGDQVGQIVWVILQINFTDAAGTEQV
jgi:hypothetical protein